MPKPIKATATLVFMLIALFSQGASAGGHIAAGDNNIEVSSVNSDIDRYSVMVSGTAAQELYDFMTVKATRFDAVDPYYTKSARGISASKITHASSEPTYNFLIFVDGDSGLVNFGSTSDYKTAKLVVHLQGKKAMALYELLKVDAVSQDAEGIYFEKRTPALSCTLKKIEPSAECVFVVDDQVGVIKD